MQEWRDIVGYEGHYQVSNDGKVRSVKSGDYILKGDTQRNGYKRVYLWKDGKKKNCLVHRLVATAFLPNGQNHSDVNHLDQNKANNCVSNLEWCSHLHNMNYGDVRLKISESHKGRTTSEATKLLLKADSSNKRWVNNGEKERFVKIDYIADMIAAGWIPGRVNKKGV